MSTPWASRRPWTRPCRSASRDVPDARPHGRGPLRPRLHRPASPGLHLRHLQPGRQRPGRQRLPSTPATRPPTRRTPTSATCWDLPGVPVGDAKRIFRGIELTARKAFSQTVLGAGLVPVLDPAGQLLGGDPRGFGPDGPRHQRRLRLLAVQRQRLRRPGARPDPPVPAGRGVQRALRSFGRWAVLREERGTRPRVWATTTASIRTCCTSTPAAPTDACLRTTRRISRSPTTSTSGR